MYGLIIESIVAFIRKAYGDDKWLEIRRLGKIEQHSFSTHLIYPETTIPRMVETAADLLGISRDDLLVQFGNFFVEFISQYGYDKILRVLGRHMRDFLNGLDNLHEYLRFSYPKLKPPSFFVEKENEHGLMLHYRSKRRYGGYVRYVMGQIKSVGEIFYGLDIDIELIKEEFLGNTVHVTMQLRFDNSAFLTDGHSEQDILTGDMKIDSDMFFEAFPFHVVFTEDMNVKSVGHGLANVCPSIEGYDISHIFNLKRPMVEFTWDQVMSHTNNVFEMESVDSVQKKNDVDYLIDSERHRFSDIEDDIDPNESDITDLLGEGMKLHLKGQMIWVPEWQGMLFLGTPVLPNLTAMFDTGLFINDLSLHDNSRDLVLAGTQTSAELKLALDQEQIKSKKLEDSMRKLDEEMRRTDELLYQMIPRTIADRLRAGEPALETCQVFNDVTVLFSDVVGFTMICSRISPLQVVTMLNMMYSKFDQLCSTNDVYKVETIGDAYVVVSGAPEEVTDHAERIADMAIGMLETMPTLVDPSTASHLQIRVGLNSGVVVAGVVGLKMPRYCLFGDTVNTAAKMESSSQELYHFRSIPYAIALSQLHLKYLKKHKSENILLVKPQPEEGERNDSYYKFDMCLQSMKIQMSEATMNHLSTNPKYVTSLRGLIDIKDKGKMNTYWLGKSDDYGKLLIIRKIAAAPPPRIPRTATMSRPTKPTKASDAKPPATTVSKAEAAAPAQPVPPLSPSEPVKANEKPRKSSLSQRDSGYANSVKSDLPTVKDLPQNAEKKERKPTSATSGRTPKTGANMMTAPPSIELPLSPATANKYSFPIKPKFTEPKDLSVAHSDVDSESELDSDDSRRAPRKANQSVNQNIDRKPQMPPAQEKDTNIFNSNVSNGPSNIPGKEKVSPKPAPPIKQISIGKHNGRKESMDSMDSAISPIDKRAPIFDFEQPVSPLPQKAKPPQPARRPIDQHGTRKQEETDRSDQSDAQLSPPVLSGQSIPKREMTPGKPAEPVTLQLSRQRARLPEPVKLPEAVVNGVDDSDKNLSEQRNSDNSSTESKVIRPTKTELKVKPKAPVKRAVSPRPIEQSPKKIAEVEIVRQSIDLSIQTAAGIASVQPAVTASTASQTSHVDLRAEVPRITTTASVGTDAQSEPITTTEAAVVQQIEITNEVKEKESTNDATEKKLTNEEVKEKEPSVQQEIAHKENEPQSNGNKETNNLAVPVQPDEASVNSFDKAVDELVNNEFASFKGKKAAKVSVNGKVMADGSAEKINGHRGTGPEKGVVVTELDAQRRSIRSCACIIS